LARDFTLTFNYGPPLSYSRSESLRPMMHRFAALQRLLAEPSAVQPKKGDNVREYARR
jgi:hypothetical protein